MRAIKIDAEIQKIYVADIDSYNINEKLKCDFAASYHDSNMMEDCILLYDDLSMYKDIRHGFYINNKLFAGNGLIVRKNESAILDCNMELNEVEDMIEFESFN